MEASDLEQEIGRQTPSPLPPLPSEVLSKEQWGILSAIADTVIPSFTPLEGNRLLKHPLRIEVYKASCEYLENLATAPDRPSVVARYLGENATDQAEFKNNVTRLLSWNLHDQARQDLLFILSTLK